MAEMNDSSAVQDKAYIGFIKNVKEDIFIKGAVANIKRYSPSPSGEFERDGIKYKLVEEKSVENTVCDLGNAMAARRFMSAVETMLLTHMAVGTGTGGKTSASTTLQSEVGRVALDSLTCPAGGAANDNVVTAVATFPAGTGTGALVEAAMLTAVTDGTMFCYADYGVVTKGAADIVIFTWTITFGTS